MAEIVGSSDYRNWVMDQKGESFCQLPLRGNYQFIPRILCGAGFEMISSRYQRIFPETMAKQLLVRNVSDEILSEIERQRKKSGVSRQTFIMSILKKATMPTKQREGDGSDGKDAEKFTFIDLFAGIGGFRTALEDFGGKCVMSSEWDKHAQQTYQAWHGELPLGDITKIDPNTIPDHDIVAAGFPCQPFSIAGVSKKISLGRAHGFKDKKQGNMFFHLAEIIETKRPPVLLLENVKNLKSHDKGNTWRVIKETLEGLDYVVFAEIIDAAHWVPQHRERIFIIGFDKKRFGKGVEFSFPARPKVKPKLADILEAKPDSKYVLTDNLWAYLQRYAEKHREKGNGFGFGMADLNGSSRTLSARYHKDGSEILIPRGKGKNPRRLTPRECQRLMGYPNKPIVVSDTQAYRQFGNGVVVPVVRAVVKQIVTTLDRTGWKPGMKFQTPKPVQRTRVGAVAARV